MPVTARLSRHFYERFGDQLTSELVGWFNAVDSDYRSQLRELNESNFARFDAKLDQRLAEFEARIERHFGEVQVAIGNWMFVFWTGQTVALGGLLYALLGRR
jgi:hypothetical protein